MNQPSMPNSGELIDITVSGTTRLVEILGVRTVRYGWRAYGQEPNDGDYICIYTEDRNVVIDGYAESREARRRLYSPSSRLYMERDADGRRILDLYLEVERDAA